MATKINYVDEVWNPVVGCTKCGLGCENCYAEKMARRLAYMGQVKYSYVIKARHIDDKRTWNSRVFCDESALAKPLHWRKPRRILVPSMGDLFHEGVPFGFIDRIFGIMFAAYQHTYLILTKRVERMAEYIHHLDDKCFECGDPTCWSDKPNPNIHLGVTVCNQKEADEKIPILLRIPAAHRWLSIEPMLGEINIIESVRMAGYQWGCDGRHHGIGTPECPRELHHHHDDKCKFPVGQVIVGCESGPNSRECKPEWIKSIVEQCKTAGVKCFVKQMEVNGKVVHDLKDMPSWAVQEI